MTLKPHVLAAAENLLRRFNQDRAPIDVRHIVQGLGITIKSGNLGEETSGLIYREKGSTVVGLNSTQSHQRQRFTLAHECGHFLLHREKDLWVDSQMMFRSSAQPKDHRELDANEFAAELLMPREMIMAEQLDVESQPVPQIIDRLAKKYDVSIPAMTIRLVNLNLLPQF